MITAVVVVVIVGLVLSFVVIFAKDPGPPPVDVALAYEEAWDRFDFESLWELSGDELRDGMDRKTFVQAKQQAYADRPELGHLARSIAVEQVRESDSIATVRTRVDLFEGGATVNEIHLEHRKGRWTVVLYHLEPEARSSGA